MADEDDAQKQSYNEFKKNMERKVREDNLKAIEDEMKRPLFPNTFTDLWKKGMAKNANPEDVREEVDSLPDGGLYNVSIRFENMTPEVVSWLMGSMDSYIRMAREIKIESVERDGK